MRDGDARRSFPPNHQMPRTLRIAIFLPDPPDFDIRNECFAPDCAGGTRHRLPAVFELASARFFGNEIAFEYKEFIFHHPESWPNGEELKQFDAAWITGADEGAYDLHVPYVPVLESYVAEHVNTTRWLGISFGHQILAWALNPGGGNVVKNPAGWECAAVEATLSEKGRELLKTEKTSYFIHNHHGDAVLSAPPGTTALASSAATPVQSILSDRIFTNEGHLEYSRGLMECWALWDPHFGLYSREQGLEFLEKRTEVECDNKLGFIPDAIWMAGKMVGWMLNGLAGIPTDVEMPEASAANAEKAAVVQEKLEKKLCEELFEQRIKEYGGDQKVAQLRAECARWRYEGVPLPHPEGIPSALTNDHQTLLPLANVSSPRTLKFNWPSFRIGTAEYLEGPTGCTVFHFPSGAATCAHDVRGGSPGSYMPGSGRVDAVCFAGGSVYGLEAAVGVAAALFEQRGYSWRWRELQIVRGAIIYDFGKRQNAVYPDKELGKLALKSARAGEFPLGARGAGCSATVGKLFKRGEQAGQGAAFREFGRGGKIACFTVVNSIGAIYDRGNRIVRGSLDPSQHRVWHAEPGSKRLDIMEATEVAISNLTVEDNNPAANVQPPMGNTTITLVVTNLSLPQPALDQLAKQVHASMARAIQPFHCPEDGDQLYFVSTNELSMEVGMGVFGTMAGEVAWDAVLSCFDDC